jgi:hypothetical protein
MSGVTCLFAQTKGLSVLGEALVMVHRPPAQTNALRQYCRWGEVKVSPTAPQVLLLTDSVTFARHLESDSKVRNLGMQDPSTTHFHPTTS